MGKLNVVVPATSVIVEGVEYRKVEREAQSGDIVQYGGYRASFLTEGAFYLVYVDGDDDVVIEDEDGDALQVNTIESITVFEPVSKPVARPTRLTVGDYAKVISKRTHDYEVGSVVKITVDENDHQPYKAERADGTVGNWLREREVVRATDEDVAAAKAALAAKLDPRNHFAEGDKVRLIAKGDRLNGYEVGKVYTVVKPFADDARDKRVKITGGTIPQGYAKADELVKVTAQETLTAKWAAIGRQVNEYKRGDIVSYVKGGVSAMGTVEDVSSMLLGVRVATTNLNDDSAKYSAVYKVEHNAVLLVPVEQRFDLVG